MDIRFPILNEAWPRHVKVPVFPPASAVIARTRYDKEINMTTAICRTWHRLLDDLHLAPTVNTSSGICRRIQTCSPDQV